MSIEVDTLRLYINDPDPPKSGGDPVLDDDQLQTIIDENDGDIDAAAAEGWRIKAATFSDWYDVTMDRADTLERSQVFQHCLKMQQMFADASGGEIKSIRMEVTEVDSNASEMA